MATFISLISYTDQGIRNVKDSPARAEAFKEMAKKLGVTVLGLYWTVGNYDIILALEGPDDESVTTALLGVATLGNVRTQTLRAFNSEQMEAIIANMP